MSQPGQPAGYELVCGPANASAGNAKQWVVDWWIAVNMSGVNKQ